MIRVRHGRVLAILHNGVDIQLLRVLCEDQESEAVSFPTMVGEVKPGDTVVLNTTAVSLKLGTGGAHFVMALSGRDKDTEGLGHIMKLRYTPVQIKMLSVEEEASPFHTQMKETCDLQGMPVAVATLHSLVAPFAVAFKQVVPRARLAYIMTDGAALPVSFSKLVRALKKDGWLDVVVTCGHAFGGDLEAVTPYSALQAARVVAKCHACIIAMGPGVVGTGTPLGTTALEQAPLLDAAGALGARTLGIPRVSFADRRARHYGLSHHTQTALGRLVQRSTTLVLPCLSEEKHQQLLQRQCRESGIVARHQVVWEPVADVATMLLQAGVSVTTMGRTPAEDPAFFAAGAASGQYMARLCCD